MPMYYLYARRSSDSEDRQVLSIESQVNELSAYAESHGIGVREIFQESQSAKAPGRPVFAQMLEKTLRGRVDGILCWKLDRLARNPVDGGALIWALDAGKLKEIATPERTFQNTGNDKFWMQLEFGIAKKYVDDLADNVRRGNRAKLEQGWIPGLAPLGYSNDRLTRTIIPDPDRFPLIRRLWELVLQGTPPMAALEILNDEWGFRTRRFPRTGGRPMVPSAIYRLLTNRFYYGLVERGGSLYHGAHVPMITKEEFDRVQTLLRSRRRKQVRRFLPYTQLLKCGGCGSGITGEVHLKPSGKRYTYYRCTRKSRTVRCTERPIPGPQLELQIASIIDRLVVPQPDLEPVVRRLCGGQDRSRFTSVLRTTQVRTLGDLKRQKQRLIDLYVQGLIEEDEYRLRLSRITASMDALNRQLNERPDGGPDPETLLKQPFVTSVREYLAKAGPERARALLSLLGNFSLKDGQITLVPASPIQLS